MSELGELLGYTDYECPNCGRMRVESWSCGKHICEKCHWCLEDNEYYHEKDECYSVAVNFGDYRKLITESEEKRLASYKERAEALVESLKRSFDGDVFSTIPLCPPESEITGEQLTDVQIRKQLKYEKNPMRVKQLNKMLSGRRKKRK